MSFIWREIAGAWVRFPLVQQALGHIEVEPTPEVKVYGRGDLDNPPALPGKKYRGARDPDVVDTVCVHQTGIEFGTTRRQRRIHGGELKALLARFCRTPYHDIALKREDVFENHPRELYTYASNRVNKRSMAVAVEGRFPRFAENRKDKHTVLTEGLVQAGHEAMRRAHGPGIRYVTAHCCWSGDRLADPGEEVWQLIVTPMMVELDLEYLDVVDARNGGADIPLKWWGEYDA